MAINLLLLFFILGLSAGSALPLLPSASVGALSCAAALFFLLLYSHDSRAKRRSGAAWLLLAALCAGFSWAVFYGHHLFAQRLPDAYATADFLVEGTVINLPEQTERGERFDLAVEKVVRASLPLPRDLSSGKLRLNSYDITPLNIFQYQPGQRWQLWVRLKPPRGMVNPDGFDYEGWLLQEGYSAVGYVRNSSENILLEEHSSTLNALAIKVLFDHWGFASLQWINTHVENSDQRALFAAIALGYKEEFTRHHWDLLKNTGTIHLVVVSGLNIVLAASVGYFFLGWLSRLLFFPLYIATAPVWGAMGAVVVAVFYAGMTGLSLPTQRSLVMVLCGLLTFFLRRQIIVSNGFMLALTAVLMLDPLAGFTASLWLSFGAVAVLLYRFSSRLVLRRKKTDLLYFLQQWLSTQVCVSLGIFPILAYWMGSVPLVMPAANLFAVPFATFVLLPLTIFSGLSFAVSATLGHVVLGVTDWSMDLFWKFLQFMQIFNVNWFMTMSSDGRGDTPSILLAVFAALAVAVLLSPHGVLPRGYGIFLLLPLLQPIHHRLLQGEFELTVIDVGQGLGLLVETRDTITVYDVGDHYSNQFDIGRDVVAPLVRRKGYDHVDTLLISHADSDHAGGLKGLLGELPVSRTLSGNASIIQQRLADDTRHRFDNIKVESCVRGQHWLWNDVQFEVLSPEPRDGASALVAKRNNYSCVVKISNAHAAILLTGDIESDQERNLLAATTVRKVNVLVVPHHGSKTSSSPAFLQALAPDLALASLGYKSQYGHPHAEVVERYRSLGIPFLRTDQLGAITWNSQNSDQSAESSRLNGWGYWHRW